MRKPSRDSNESRKAALARTAKTLDKWQAKVALAKEWEHIDKSYYQKLMNEASKLHATLVVKGVL
jgi:hypothetical protein